jgi:hypothetical protein
MYIEPRFGKLSGNFWVWIINLSPPLPNLSSTSPAFLSPFVVSTMIDWLIKRERLG